MDDSVQPEKPSVADPATAVESIQPLERSVSVLDFAYSSDDPLHYGIYNSEEEYRQDASRDDLDDNKAYDDDDDDGQDANADQFVVEVSETNGEESDSDNGEDEVVHAVALYRFVPENENELPLESDQIIIIKYEYGDGWLVAFDPATDTTGLVPSSYVQIVGNEVEFAGEVIDEEESSTATQYLPTMLRDKTTDDDEKDDVNTNTAAELAKLRV